LVRARQTGVGDRSLRVTPPREWNRQRGQLFVDIREVEDWTLNGPFLDGISFVTGLKSERVRGRSASKDQREKRLLALNVAIRIDTGTASRSELRFRSK
jgi:hypothetical protein